MKKILGLDLGTSSIGWALIEVDDNSKPIRIIAMGSRIIPLTSADRDQFQKGQAISKNQDRTTARTQRKGYDRKQLRKSEDFRYGLKKALRKLNIYPSDELFKLSSLDLWKLRNDAASVDGNISPEQLGRILYMLNQKRGYKSARSEANADKKDTDYVAEVKGRYSQLKDRNQTVGQYLYDELVIANRNNTYFRVKEKVYPREAYEEEFDTIINIQKKKHSFLTDEVINQLRNEIIYYQRKLKSQKGLVSVCEFEGFTTTNINNETQKEKTMFVGPKVAPRTSPLFQLCKIWEVVNNISLKVKNTEGSKYKWGERIPTLEEKHEIAKHLSVNANLSFTDLLKILHLKKEQVYANKQILKGIQGNVTYTEIHNIIGDNELLRFHVSVILSEHSSMLIDKKTGEILAEKEGLQLDAKLEQEPLYQLWHTIYSIKDLDECKKALIKRFEFNVETADKLSRIDFNKQGFGDKSNKAMRKILPYLMQGFDYSQSCSLAGYNHSNSLTKEEQEQRKTIDKLELLPKNSLRQPVVEKIINQMINVVNAILDKYGKPNEIRVELARELKQSKEERNDATVHNTANEAINKEIENRLNELGIKANKRSINKYKLVFPIRAVINGKTGKTEPKKLKEAKVINRCIYCGESFNLSEALTGDNFDVDHIIPKDLLPIDDSQTNKVLVHRKCNSTKTNQTAFDFLAKKGEAELEAYLERIDSWFKQGILSYGKMLRLKVSHEEYLERKKQKKETEADKKLWENFLDRDLRATQYIARKSTEILRQICNNVTATEGSVTAKLRNLWGWNDVLMNLQLPKYKELEKQTGEKFTVAKEWVSEHGKRKHQKEEIANWTKRDDHRHHAIDALVIACTKQGFIQRINTLNASDVKDEMRKEVEKSKTEYNEKLTLLDKYLIDQKPFATAEVMKEAEKILVSFKAGKKIATISKFKATGKNKEKGVIVPRGALHEQSVYGKIKVVEKDKPLKYLFENSQKIIDVKIRILVENRLNESENDVLKALNSLKKNPIFLDDKREKKLDKASCYTEATVLKYKLENLKLNQVDSIVDKKVKQLVRDRLQKHNNKEKEAFKETLWFNEERQIPVLTVRLFARPDASSLAPIKRDEKGRDIGYVITGNNHHVAIYSNINGRHVQHTCTFWHAVERKKYKVPYIIRDTTELWNSLINCDLPQSFLKMLPEDNLNLQFSMQQNEMFILGMSKEEFDDSIRKNDKALLSKFLYLVWSISENDYWFRHHLETKNSELKIIDGAKESKRFFRFKSIGSLVNLNPIKVRLNHLGEITKVGE